jgi:hypothetical protein
VRSASTPSPAPLTPGDFTGQAPLTRAAQFTGAHRGSSALVAEHDRRGAA